MAKKIKIGNGALGIGNGALGIVSYPKSGDGSAVSLPIILG